MFGSLNRIASGRLSCRRQAICGWAALALASCVAGCQSTKPVIVRHEVVQLADLGVTGATAETNAYARVETQASIGRFPAGVAVARLMLEDSAAGGKPALVIDTLSDAEAPYWNELFDSVVRIREVTLIDPQSVPQRYVTIPQLLASARRQKCRLCVVYAQNDVADNASEIVGAVYDSDTNELVGVAVAAETVDPSEKREPPRDYPRGDKRNADAHYMTARKFEALVREFVLDLINRDREPGSSAETTTRPAPPGPAPVQSGETPK